MELIGDYGGERRAEDAARAGEDKLRHVSRAALVQDRFQQIAHAVEIDAVALVEIALGLAGDDRGKVEDQVRTECGEFLRHSRVARILDADRRPAREIGRQGGGRDIGEGEFANFLAGATSLARQTFRQFPADHAGRPRDQNMHGRSLPVLVPGRFLSRP